MAAKRIVPKFHLYLCLPIQESIEMSSLLDWPFQERKTLTQTTTLLLCGSCETENAFKTIKPRSQYLMFRLFLRTGLKILNLEILYHKIALNHGSNGLKLERTKHLRLHAP